MLNVLYRYLILNDHVSIPGVGNFTVHHQPALLSGNTIQPPATTVSFEGGTAITDKQFYTFLAKEKGLSEVDAVRRYQDFAYQLKKDITANTSVELNGLGVLTKDPHGNILFEAVPSAQQYFSAITLNVSAEVAPAIVTATSESVTTEEETETENIRKDRWGIWAGILAAVAIAAIAWYYLTESNY